MAMADGERAREQYAHLSTCSSSIQMVKLAVVPQPACDLPKSASHRQYAGLGHSHEAWIIPGPFRSEALHKEECVRTRWISYFKRPSEPESI
ncbi:hypothetical protein DICSQDRAFT_134051 [Dichomitus squalens LYAD-421 SS1]|uniref:uncharacterized protein n=1 Tax=Dichomitus squalens (strain LYAD-421) TaxID=732165 RepID=UPI0004413412|nr:uncharacterized protein DICSQDRAFT_134051 [Dichomitus squalens LYAD-421 SS1]EJF64398.1 hypothetical protein DICSQDRAFT_134051 [Dichomitus squalens LYAD-421 SS1]